MATALPISFSHNPAPETKSYQRTAIKYLNHWIKSPHPYVHPDSGVMGIVQIPDGAKGLIRKPRRIIKKYLKYFHRIAQQFFNQRPIAFDMLIDLKKENGAYKPPLMYVIYVYVYIIIQIPLYILYQSRYLL